MSKDSFLLYKDSLDVLDELTIEQVADLFFAIRDYQNGNTPKLAGLMKAVFLPFKNQFDRDLKRYKEVVEKRRKAGERGGKANACKDKQMKANACKDKQKTPDNVPVPVPVPDNVPDNVSEEKDIPYGISKKKEAKIGCRFEKSEFFADVAPDEFVREAERTNPNVDPFDQYQRFKDYWTSKSGKDATKLDWVATWRNWLRNSYSGGNRAGAAKQKSAAELFADMTNW